jgi:hypothetical protein
LHQRDHVHGCWPNSRPNHGQWQAAPCSSCRVLHPFGKAGGSHIAPHAICWYTCPARPYSIIEGETSETSEVVAHSSHAFLRRHASAPRARERA